jgi:hypothetical protein
MVKMGTTVWFVFAKIDCRSLVRTYNFYVCIFAHCAPSFTFSLFTKTHFVPTATNSATMADQEAQAPLTDPETTPIDPDMLPDPPVLRILCLHDANSNAGELKKTLDRLGDRLYQQHAIDLVYVNSPLTVTTTTRNTSANTEENATQDLEERRVWWYSGDDDDKPNYQHNDDKETNNENCQQTNQPEPTFVGLDASLLLLRQVWTSLCPVWGVLGVGQGAAVASILALLPNLTPPPTCSIYVDGLSILPEDELLNDNCACLHLLTTSDSVDPSTERLVRQFGGTVQHKSSPSLDKADLNAIGKFVVDCKKVLLQTSNPSTQSAQQKNVLALCTALHLTETVAAAAIAEQIAANPPAALMAVIRPQAVSGWSGSKRNPAGGGAPCPSEFLLHREKRQSASADGPAKVHPSEQHQDGEKGS